MTPSVLSLILGGGRGTRLYPLTKHRSKPAMPVAGKYRLIDIPISNCINSGLNRVYVLTQFLSVSLHRHIGNTFKFDMFDNGFVELLAAQQTNEETAWYQGTADAVRQNIRYIREDPSNLVLILSGDQLYRMDFRKLIQTHRDSRADVTIAALPVAEDTVDQFGVLRTDDAGRIMSFAEKPKTAEARAPYHIPADFIERRGIKAAGRHFLASMGIYLFNKETLLELLTATPATDFGKEVFPRALRTHKVHIHLFDGYWEDLGTIGSYHEASLALAGENPPFDFHSPEGVIYTRMRFLPASRIDAARMSRSLVSDGCVIQSGTEIDRCIIGVRSRIGHDVALRDTVIIGADRFETDAERAANRTRNLPDLNIGDGCAIERAILDKDCRVGRNVRIRDAQGQDDRETDQYCVRDGIVVVPRGAVIPDGTVI
jgi:glucose-1-phosphate adenylyltransferase